MGVPRCKHMCLHAAVWCLAAFLTIVLTQADEPELLFNLGAVLQIDSALAEGEQAAQCPGTEMMSRGFELAVERLNEGIGHGINGQVTKLHIKSAQGIQHRILFNYTRYQAACEKGDHTAHVEQAVNDGAHFLLGNTHFAFSEAAIANKAKKLVYHCCADADELFVLGYKYVYGMAGSIKKDTRQALTSMALEGSIRSLFVYYTEDFRYARVACMAAIEHATTFLSQLNADFKLVSVLKYSFQNVSSVPNFYDSVLAEEVVRSGAEAVVGCDHKGAGIQTAKAFGRRGLYLKSIFMTWAPMYPEFVESVGRDTAEHTLTATHWHPSARGLADTFFGTPMEYAAAFKKKYGSQPDVLNALASATVLSLAWAIQSAFEQCTLVKEPMDAGSLLFDPDAIQCVDSLGVPFPNSPTGYDLVLKSLASQSVTTFFGGIEFNSFQRNIAAQPLTLQVLSGVNQVVLPLEQASKKLIMPVPKPAPPKKESHIGVLGEDNFIALVLVLVLGTLLLVAGILLFVITRRMRRQHADRVKSLLVIPPEHLQIINLPICLTDGSWESGKAILQNSLVALEPLSEVTLAGTSCESSSVNKTRRIPVNSLSLDGGTPRKQGQGLIASTEGSPMGFSNSEPTVKIDMEALHGQDLKHNKKTTSRGDFSNVTAQNFDSPRPISESDITSVGNDVGVHSRLTRFRRKQHQQSLQNKDMSHTQIVDLVLRARTLQHPSVVPVTGIVWSLPGLSSSTPVLVMECQELGTLTSVMENETVELDFLRQLDIAKDLASALAYLHAQENPQLGPALPNKLCGVMLNKHCRAKLRVPLTALHGPEDCGETSKHQPVKAGMLGEANQSELSDSCQFGLGVASLFTTEKSSENSQTTSSSVGGMLQMVEGSAMTWSQLHELQLKRGPSVAQLLRECCALDTHKRPCFTQICKRLEDAEPELIRVAQQATCWDAHSAPLKNKQSADKLLYELFPAKVAEALKNGQIPDPEPYPCISLFFSDIVGYTSICSNLSTQDVMDLLHRLYSRFDDLATARGLFKVETIGDAYLCAGNLRHPQPDTHAALMADFAFSCCSAALEEPVCLSRPDLGFIHIRVGIHTGPVTGAVLGTLNRRFCLLGDCVNVASRMESTSTKDHIQCSAAFQELLQQQWPEAASLAEPQEAKLIKGKGIMHTFYLYPPKRAYASFDAISTSLGSGPRAPPQSPQVLQDVFGGW